MDMSGMSGMSMSMSTAAAAAATTAMDMSASGTGMAMPAATSAAAAMDMGGMGGMGGPDACKISMLWNWYTIDSCFLSASWHVRSAGGFAGSCIGVICLVIALEFLRRVQRETDRYFHRAEGAAARGRASPSGSAAAVGGGRAAHRSGSSDSSVGASKAAATTSAGPAAACDGPACNTEPGQGPFAGRLRLWQQVVRSLLYMLQFAVGYFVMLLAMYYNGYIIICIFIGAFLGAMIFQWDTYSHPS